MGRTLRPAPPETKKGGSRSTGSTAGDGSSPPFKQSQAELETLGEDPITEPVDDRPLPDSIVDSVSFVRAMDAAAFLSDLRYNPSQRTFSPGERFYIGSQVEIARGRIQVLEQEIISICASALDGLRSEGEFVLYGPNEPPRSVDAVTFGEQTDGGGMRLYAFYEEEYPEIYAKKAEQRRIAEELLRSLLDVAGGDS